MYGRKDRLIKEERHDVYKEKNKWPEPTVCPECGALFIDGRWSWEKVSIQAEVHRTICPACRRITEQYPAGYLDLSGPFLGEHQADILNLVYNIEKREKEQHPMERIISTTHGVDHISITTTGVHLARRIGEALSRAYKGELSFHYGDGEETIRVTWQR